MLCTPVDKFRKPFIYGSKRRKGFFPQKASYSLLYLNSWQSVTLLLFLCAFRRQSSSSST